MRRPILPLLLLFLCLAFTATARPPVNTARLDSLFSTLERNNKTMCAIAIAQDGNIVYQRHAGYRDITKTASTRPDDSTAYRIASISKMFTAVMVLQLIEEGKLRYDTKLSAYFPMLPGADTTTLARMLNHHSGLPRYDRVDDQEHLRRKKTEAELIAYLSDKKGNPEDVAKGHYSNLNYILLGFIIEHVTGHPFAQELAQRITGPLGLRHTYNQQNLIRAAANEAHSFSMHKGVWTEDYEYPWAFLDASGLMMSTPADLLTFINALFTGRLVHPATLARMTDIKETFGMALFNTPFYEHMGYGHTGRIEGFVSAVTYFPADKLSVAFICNGQVYPMNDILIGVLSILYNQPYEIPDLAPVALTDAQQEALTGTYYGKELDYILYIKKNSKGLYGQIKKKGGLLKQVFTLEALGERRLIYNDAGYILDYDTPKEGVYKTLLMRVSGAKLHMERWPG